MEEDTPKLQLPCAAHFSRPQKEILQVADQMTSFLADTNVINNVQNGFVKGLSTTTNLLESFNDWTISIQACKSVTVAYVDFAKAFDSVSHPKLLYQLRQYGIDGCLLDWIRNFLHSFLTEATL